MCTLPHGMLLPFDRLVETDLTRAPPIRVTHQYSRSVTLLLPDSPLGRVSGVQAA